jgi:hypothetical protein
MTKILRPGKFIDLIYRQIVLTGVFYLPDRAGDAFGIAFPCSSKTQAEDAPAVIKNISQPFVISFQYHR